MSRVILACKLAAVIIAAGAPAPAAAQAYPSRPVRYLVPFPAGGSPDIVARLVADRLTRLWGVQVVVDNRSGAGGTVAGTVAARAAPDGYTLFQCNIASNAIAQTLHAKLPYDGLRDFAPISLIGTTQSGIVAHPSLAQSTVGELIAHAKANPGRLSYGSSGAGSSPHLGMELFKTMAGIDIVHVAYKGAAPALADLMGGQVPLAVSNVPALLAPIQSGRMRGIAVTGLVRVPQLPSVPTVAESGLPGYEVTSWYGLCAPAGTPVLVLEKVRTDLPRVLAAADVRQRLTDLVVEPAPTGRDEFAAFIRSETARWAKVARDAGLVPQ